MVYTKDSFYDFDAVKLEAWLRVYLNEEGKNKYREKIWETVKESDCQKKY